MSNKISSIGSAPSLSVSQPLEYHELNIAQHEHIIRPLLEASSASSAHIYHSYVKPLEQQQYQQQLQRIQSTQSLQQGSNDEQRTNGHLLLGVLDKCLQSNYEGAAASKERLLSLMTSLVRSELNMTQFKAQFTREVSQLNVKVDAVEEADRNQAPKDALKDDYYLVKKNHELIKYSEEHTYSSAKSPLLIQSASDVLPLPDDDDVDKISKTTCNNKYS